jgi:hypothetical protein
MFQDEYFLPLDILEKRHDSSRHVLSLTAGRFGESRRSILPRNIVLRTGMVSARFVLTGSLPENRRHPPIAPMVACRIKSFQSMDIYERNTESS